MPGKWIIQTKLWHGISLDKLDMYNEQSFKQGFNAINVSLALAQRNLKLITPWKSNEKDIIITKLQVNFPPYVYIILYMSRYAFAGPQILVYRIFRFFTSSPLLICITAYNQRKRIASH